MFSNSSSCASVNNFKELDELVNMWSARLEENLCQFHEQVNACNSYFFKITNLHKATEPIARNLGHLQLQQDEVNRNIEFIKYNLITAEQAISLLERIVPNTCQCAEGNCSFHNQPYHLIDDVYCSIRNVEGMLAAITEKLPFANEDDLTEQVAGIMQADLQELENIEVKTEQLKELLNQIEYGKNVCFHVYGLQKTL